MNSLFSHKRNGASPIYLLMSKLGKVVVLLLSLTGLGAWSVDAVAAIKTSVAAGGTWSTAATWSPAGVPATGDTVIIAGPGAVDISGTITQTAAGSVTVNSGASLTTSGGTITFGALTISSGGTATIRRPLIILGATNITGRINFGSTNATVRAMQFRGAVTLNSGAVWDETNGGANAVLDTFNFQNGLANNGTTFTALAGVHTFNTTAQTISGTSAITIPNLTVATVAVTNNGTLTVSTALAGTTGSLVNGATGTLNIGGTSGITTLTATAAGNTVNYTGAAQTVKATAYSNLGLAGSAAKTMAATTISGNFTMSGTATTAPTGALAVGGNFTIGATNTFAAGTFTHNVGGNWSNSGTFTANTSTMNFNGTAAQAIGGSATTGFNNLTISNTAAAVSLNPTTNLINVAGTLNMNGAATVLAPAAGVVINNAAAAGTITGTGTVQVTRTAATADYSNQYKFTTNTLTSLTVSYAGASAQTVSVQPYGGLNINNASGVSLTANTTVAGTLTLANGKVNTGAFTLITTLVCNAPSVTRTNGWVFGYLQKAIPNGASTCNFEVGDAANYTPVSFTFVAGTTAGNLTARTVGSQHPSIADPTSGLDTTKMVNRYWMLTNGGVGLPAAGYSATFNFINGTPVDLTSGANPLNFSVEKWSGVAWSSTTLVAPNLTSTTATVLAAFGDFAVGEKKPTNPGDFDVYDPAIACNWSGAGTIWSPCWIHTKIAGAAFNLNIVAINPAGTGVFTTFTGIVKVELLDASDSSAVLDSHGCRSTWVPSTLAAIPNQTFIAGDAGRHSVTGIVEPNAWRNVRVRVSYPTTSPTAIGCSTDNFAIRPNNLTISSVTDSNWSTAGITRALNNGPTVPNPNATGGVVHKAGQPFTISATAYNAAGTPVVTSRYDGSPTVGSLACTLPTPTCTNGVLTPGTWSASSGTVTTTTATYPEAGAFNLTLEDRTFAAVDAADGTTADCTASGYYVCPSAAVSVGRFVPDHFEVTALTPAPKFKTFCSAGAAFTYIGQPFGYATAPQATILARNAAGITTANYSATLWKIGTGTSSSSKACTTGPDLCQFTSAWTGTSLGSGVAETYAYTLTPVSTPGWDGSGAATAAATVTAGTGANIGTGTVAISASNALAFLRSTSAPQATFTAAITDSISVTDSSENAVANNGIITTTTPLVFNGTGSGIAFDSGNGFRYGRLKLSNAYGSELLPILVPVTAYWWDGTSSSWQGNTDDSCTSLAANAFALSGGISANTSASAMALSGGSGTLTLSKPTPVAAGSVDVAVNLGITGTTADVSCNTTHPLTTTAANKPWLQGNWCGVAGYVRDPNARIKFGSPKAPYIYLREQY